MREFGAFTLSVSEEEFFAKPEPKKWSPAECMAHLTVVAKNYQMAVKTGLAEDNTSLPNPALSKLVSRLILSLEPPPRVKLPAPKMFASGSFELKGDERKSEVLQNFVDAHQVLIDKAKKIGERDPNIIRIRSPVIRFLWFSFPQFYLFLAMHIKRHLWQAKTAVGNSKS